MESQIEGAQKKVEEQNFVARKNVLKYDDVMNTQRQVIYEQRRRVLEGEDLSGEVKAWIEEVVTRTVAQFTEDDFPEEWDLAGLVVAMHALYGSEISEAELREEVELTTEALTEEFVEDAVETYTEKETEMETAHPGLIRDVERYVMLQVVDQRWRAHLDDMDYLREGVHLRAMAQKDPLVEYRGEGHVMFEALSVTIREEVVLTLFHANIDVQPAPEPELEPGPDDNLQYAHESTRGAEAISAAGGSAATALAPPPRQTGTVTNEHREVGRNDPCWCGSGKKFKKCHGA